MTSLVFDMVFLYQNFAIAVKGHFPARQQICLPVNKDNDRWNVIEGELVSEGAVYPLYALNSNSTNAINPLSMFKAGSSEDYKLNTLTLRYIQKHVTRC